ncbi:MAG: hypothetical protein JXQ75_02170 [Phycisphaerae bacterium]|nr:hypothetical protein [Phycisphaerae bacterium]
MLKNTRFLRRFTAAVFVVGIMTQAATCTATQVLVLAADIATREAANILSDSIFLLLDNLFVRMAG